MFECTTKITDILPKIYYNYIPYELVFLLLCRNLSLPNQTHAYQRDTYSVHVYVVVQFYFWLNFFQTSWFIFLNRFIFFKPVSFFFQPVYFFKTVILIEDIKQDH